MKFVLSIVMLLCAFYWGHETIARWPTFDLMTAVAFIIVITDCVLGALKYFAEWLDA